MGLRIKVHDCQNQFHQIIVSEGEPYEIVVQMPDHDMEYELSLIEFGEPEPLCLYYGRKFERGFSEVFENQRLRKLFFEALEEQGVRALGFSDEYIAEEIIDFILSAYNSGRDERIEEALDLIEDVRNRLPWFAQTKQFMGRRNDLAIAAYNCYDGAPLYYELKMMAGRDLFQIKSKITYESKDYGMVEKQASFSFVIGDSAFDSWDAVWVGYYCTIDTMEWCVERVAESSSEPEEQTKNFLKETGYDKWEDVEERELDIKEFGYNDEDGSGNWAIFHDDYLWGRFEKEESAYGTWSVMRDAEEYSGARWNSTFGVDIKLMRLRDDLDKDEDIDYQDIDNWEEV